MEKKILITCFEPFGGESFNASAAVAENMPFVLAGYSVEKMNLPVEFGRGASVAIERAKAVGASLVLAFGEAAARKTVMPELVAINLAHATVPDNAGKMPRDEAIDPFGAAAYFTPFPVRNLAEGIRNAGVPATLSYSAGAYVCNDLYYRLMREFEGSKTRVLFVHVPRAEGVAEYAEMGKAVSAALSEILLSEAIAENVKK